MRKVLAVIFAVLLAAFTWTTLFAADEEPLFDTEAAAEHLASGNKLIAKRNYDAAIEEYEEAVSSAPSAEAYYRLGYAYYLKGRAGDEDARQMAMENFEMAYDMDPNFSPNVLGTGEVMEAPQSGMTGIESPAAAAPASALEPAPAVPAAPASQQPAAEQPAAVPQQGQ